MSKKSFKTRTRQQQNVETSKGEAMETKKKRFNFRKLRFKVKAAGSKLAKPALLTAVASGVGVASAIVYSKVTGNEISLISLQDKSELLDELKEHLDDAVDTVSEVAEAASEEI